MGIDFDIIEEEAHFYFGRKTNYQYPSVEESSSTSSSSSL